MTLQINPNDQQLVKETLDAVNGIPHRDLNQFEFNAKVRQEIAAVKDIFPNGGTPSGGTVMTVVIALPGGQEERKKVTKRFKN